MAINFLYIDDEPEKAKGFVKLLNDGETLTFHVAQPQSWDATKKDLVERQGLNEYDGLLLDLKLEFSDGTEIDVKFNGSDLAQTIRTDVKAKKINDLPIFLCSTDKNYMSFFDRTSIDLFDRKYKKETDFSSAEIKNEFIAFSNAYKALRGPMGVEEVLKRNVAQNDELVAVALELEKCKTPHEVVYLVNQFVIHANGVLLDEKLLSIRLGIDLEKSEGWGQLKTEILNAFKYEGILGDYYQRWWQDDILNWWKQMAGTSLKVLSADERVNFLRQHTGITQILPIQMPSSHTFDTFWYACRLSGLPLEASDGLRTIEMPRYAWQEPNYISLSYIQSEDRDRKAIVELLGANELKLFYDLEKQ
ncbi:hypothetical protein [Dyadobacter sp. 676]|uniref:Response regulator n=1 Tax=Dyadobacter sp. 676 TaxID=3088362 RepID=A0AAU8FHG1_9BACT